MFHSICVHVVRVQTRVTDGVVIISVLLGGHNKRKEITLAKLNAWTRSDIY